jgi:hypothetical protein
VCAEERGSHTIAGKLRRRKWERREEEGRMGSTLTRATLFIGGVTPNPPGAVPSAVQHASTTLFREVREKITVDLSSTN